MEVYRFPQRLTPLDWLLGLFVVSSRFCLEVEALCKEMVGGAVVWGRII